MGSVVFLAAASQKRRHHVFCLPIANGVNGDRNGAKRGQSRAQAGGRRSGEARGKEQHYGSKKQWVPDMGGKKAARVSAEAWGGMRRHLVGCVVLRDIAPRLRNRKGLRRERCGAIRGVGQPTDMSGSLEAGKSLEKTA